MIEKQQWDVHRRRTAVPSDGGTTKSKRALAFGRSRSTAFLPQIDHHHDGHDRAELFDHHRAQIGCVQRAPKIKPKAQRDHRQTQQHDQLQPMLNRHRNTPENSARTPARPSVIEVTHEAASRKINSVEASGKPPPADWHQ